jgi:undecaprenyl diphosphate synthase
MRIPNHIGIIPDGNRRWSVDQGMSKEAGYAAGIDPGLQLFKLCQQLGVHELTYYGFTTDNTKRPQVQRDAFTKACIEAVRVLSKEDASLLVIGNSSSPMFPEELKPYTVRRSFNNGGMRVNFLVNYGWKWDLSGLEDNTRDFPLKLMSHDISRVDLIIRWGGRRRLSGFLPVQSVYADFYTLDDYWPNFKPSHLYDALNWYNTQDVTLGG